jgi:hypothetical protein
MEGAALGEIIDALTTEHQAALLATEGDGRSDGKGDAKPAARTAAKP